MKRNKMEKHIKNLTQAKLINAGENLIDCFQTNNFENLIFGFGEWKKGFGYFTDNKFIYNRLLKIIEIPYTNIVSISKCKQMFLPMGIKITYNNGKKEVTQKFSLQKRDKWIAFLSEKSGVSCR